MKAFLIILSVIFIKMMIAEPNIEGILNSYLKVKDALVKSDHKLAFKHATELKQIIEVSTDFKERDEMLKVVRSFLKAKDVENQRAEFAELSALMWKAVQEYDSLSQSIYYQYCPMQKKFWLSKEEAIENPYYGSAMLKCGNVSESIIK